VDELKKRRFLWGVALTWTPWIPTLVGMGYAFRAIFQQNATGIGALAGALTELFVVWGIGAILIGQVAAIVLLSRAFSPGRGYVACFRSCPSALADLCSFLWAFSFGCPGSGLPTTSDQHSWLGCYTVEA
jgi:hypothetical protein